MLPLQGYGDDDYLVFDCPGQIELYSHATVFRTFVDWMRGQGWSMCAVYCLDSQFVSETPKFIAGSLQALAAMVQLELPHVNVLTKVDLIADKVQGYIACMWHQLLLHRRSLYAPDAVCLHGGREVYSNCPAVA